MRLVSRVSVLVRNVNYKHIIIWITGKKIRDLLSTETVYINEKTF